VQFEAAKQAAAQRSATSMMAADSAADMDYARVGRSDNMKRAGTVTFMLRDSVWTDVRYKKSGVVLQVKPFSDAYFKLIEMIPDLREPLSVGERVIVAGRSMAIELAPSGKERLTDADAALVRDRW
ncbi:MAG TPA: hypothetical protein VGO33_02335, partial [Gemmatimonadaceae bacterium]|nr:hypothetical protein [Gemmatimonadaceae bacterium]